MGRQEHMAIWDPFLTERDRLVFASSGYGKLAGFGKRPVVLVVDVNYNFVGDRPEPILDSVKRWRNSCGEEGWQAAERIRGLLDAARARRIPVIYSTGNEPREDKWDAGRWGDKNSRRGEAIPPERRIGNQIIPPIAPQPLDIVITKNKPSVFFGTLLAAYLVDLQADSLIVCGSTTSGCIRATVVDGFSFNYRISVVADCTFDRSESSHAMSLFDMHQKYADVVSLDDALGYLDGLPEGLFDEQMPSLRERVAVGA